MKHLQAWLCAGALAAAACNINVTPSSGGPQQPGTSGTEVQVGIPSGATYLGSTAYGDNPLRISTGITVTWTNNDTMPHTVTADDGSFNSGVLNQGQSFSWTFPTPGTFTYYCTIHGRAAMNGTLIVGDGSP